MSWMLGDPICRKMEEIWQLHQIPSSKPAFRMNFRNIGKLERSSILKVPLAYQKLLQKTKVGKHANYNKNRYILPNPDQT